MWYLNTKLMDALAEIRPVLPTSSASSKPGPALKEGKRTCRHSPEDPWLTKYVRKRQELVTFEEPEDSSLDHFAKRENVDETGQDMGKMASPNSIEPDVQFYYKRDEDALLPVVCIEFRAPLKPLVPKPRNSKTWKSAEGVADFQNDNFEMQNQDSNASSERVKGLLFFIRLDRH